MKEINISPADTYIVVNKSILNDDDRTILTMLYQPIIGPLPIILYLPVITNGTILLLVSLAILTAPILKGNITLSNLEFTGLTVFQKHVEDQLNSKGNIPMKLYEDKDHQCR